MYGRTRTHGCSLQIIFLCLHRSTTVEYSFTTEQPTVTLNVSDVDNGTVDNCGDMTLGIVELAVQNLTAQVYLDHAGLNQHVSWRPAVR
jgi:hypothetical protein